MRAVHKLAGMLTIAATIASAAGALDIFGRKWTVPEAADWQVDAEEGAPVLRLLKGREPAPEAPRRPFQFAVTDLPDYGRLTVDVDLKPLARSVLIVFAYRDSAHFDYAHLSTDTAAAQPRHNGIFHVYGGERVRISAERGPAAFAATGRWYHVKLVHKSVAGTVAVWVDGRAIPALEAVDVSLGAGKTGLGSFDETGVFRNLEIATTSGAGR
jgi:hypothetical protein